jgi:hypothetical protein
MEGLMTIYADYAADEQLLLRKSLQSAAVAISAASLGRREETVSEGFAAATFILASGPEHVRNTLVTSVIEELERRTSENQVFPDYEKVASAQGALDEAMTTLRAVAGLLDAKATPDEAADYKRWLLEIARKTALAGKEDQGFLGTGGVLVDDAERQAYAAIGEALGLEGMALQDDRASG